jgi:hypothetical protein
MHSEKLGYYLVGNKKFINKPLALIEAKTTNQDITWNFNNDIFSSCDWKTPIDQSLFDIYTDRARQLREKYDYLVLYYSGGADSINVLWTFITNNIFLDEIVMQLPEPTRKTFKPGDISNRNIYGELEYAGIPWMNKYRALIHPDTTIRYQDFAKPVIELLKNDDWFETNPTGTNFCISGIGRQVAQVTESHILKLIDNRKTVAQIVGVDKPLVHYNARNKKYYAYFSDVSAMHAPPVDLTQSEVFHKLYHTEFFYWTPDMPKLVIKQAQEIKKNCERNPVAKAMAFAIANRHISEFRPILHPVIYPPEVEVEFQTEKPSSKIIRPMDDWFWDIADEDVKQNYLNVIEYLRKNTDPKHMVNFDIDNGFSAHISGPYEL